MNLLKLNEDFKMNDDTIIAIQKLETILLNKDKIVHYANLAIDASNGINVEIPNCIKATGAIKLTDDLHVNLIFGICHNIIEHIDFNLLKTCFQSWDKFSGNVAYPIPGQESEYAAKNGLAKWTNPDRWELAEYIVNYLKEL